MLSANKIGQQGKDESRKDRHLLNSKPGLLSRNLLHDLRAWSSGVGWDGLHVDVLAINVPRGLVGIRHDQDVVATAEGVLHTEAISALTTHQCTVLLYIIRGNRNSHRQQTSDTVPGQGRAQQHEQGLVDADLVDLARHQVHLTVITCIRIPSNEFAYRSLAGEVSRHEQNLVRSR